MLDQDQPDQIIKEMDVYYNNESMDFMYLFQYPNREHVSIPDSAQFKPLSNKIKFEYPLNSNPNYYSMDRAMELGKGLSDESGKTLRSFDLTSLQTPSHASYMAGVIKSGRSSMRMDRMTHGNRWIVFDSNI